MLEVSGRDWEALHGYAGYTVIKTRLCSLKYADTQNETDDAK